MLNGLKSEVQLIHNQLQKVPLKTKKNKFPKKNTQKKIFLPKTISYQKWDRICKKNTQKKTNISLVPKLEVLPTHLYN